MTEDNDPRISKNFLIYLSMNKCREKTLALAIVDMCLHKKESPTEQFCHLEHVFKQKRGSNSAILSQTVKPNFP